MIYKDNQPSSQIQHPLRVYMQAETPQYMPQQHGQEDVFHSADSAVLDEMALLFPDATQTQSQPYQNNSSTLANTNAVSYALQTPPALYAQGSYFPEVGQTVLHAALPHHPGRSQPLSYQRYSPPTAQFTPQFSPSPHSPQPQSPATPNSSTTNRSTAMPKKEPLIRYNEKFFDYSLQGNKSLPLDPTPYGR
jgi:hypothetical protein